MKQWLGILLCCSAVVSYAKELHNFQEVYNSVKSGENISLVINFENCVMKVPVTNLVAYIKPAAVMLRKTYLQFSNSPLTTSNPSFPGQPVIENVTYKLTETANLNIVYKVISLPDYTILRESSVICPLSSAVKIFN